ncbi:nuclease-related domain-containing protein [Halalkalibacter krulwichiae]|uniref:Nuclease-related domain protein n=1 Tax=Halalkalibacter krulwichiae TaxID=199441 RepID=A0A1X9M9L5_9BACI|nr:nuclease-related domain-containing protein [Halalkalibacter krulwichiae]ARK30149.1 Nuclease-related domain protein [Halalkalibacter krulwichiae]
MDFLFLVLFIGAIVVIPKYISFIRSGYEAAGGTPFWQTLLNKGNYGEYLTFKQLKKLEGYQKVMMNLYIPKKDGLTTEVDLVLIAETGIYVFESKNYSGWIFGDEKNKNWTQSLGKRKKYSFFNPIWQNEGHIRALQTKVGVNDKDLYKSYIVFSERCTLKTINLRSPGVKVVKRNELLQTIRDDINSREKRLTPRMIDHIYSKLQKYVSVDEVIKKVHVYELELKRKNRG